MQRTVLKLLSTSQCRKIPQRIRTIFFDKSHNGKKGPFSSQNYLFWSQNQLWTREDTLRSHNTENKSKGGTRWLALNDFVSTLNILKIEGGPFLAFKKSSRSMISGIRYIRNSLHPDCNISVMGCVIVEKNSLALFTAQIYYVDCQKGHCQNWRTFGEAFWTDQVYRKNRQKA